MRGLILSAAALSLSVLAPLCVHAAGISTILPPGCYVGGKIVCTGPAGSTGQQGAAGAAGAPGTVLRSGTAAPSNATGVDGDYYLNTASGTLYQRQSGTYASVGSLQGPQGAAGPTNLNAITPGTAPPTTGGPYSVGQFEQNTTPTEQGSTGAKYIVFGWTCIAAGSPGTWVPHNVFDGN